MKLSYDNKITAKLITENIIYEVQGIQNAVLDGEATKEELEEMKTDKGLRSLADDIFNIALITGELESPTSSIVQEANHIKFNGTEVINKIKDLATVNAKKILNK